MTNETKHTPATDPTLTPGANMANETKSRCRVYVQTGIGSAGYLSHDGRIVAWARDGKTWASIEDAKQAIKSMGWHEDTSFRPGRVTAYPVAAL